MVGSRTVHLGAGEFQQAEKLIFVSIGDVVSPRYNIKANLCAVKYHALMGHSFLLHGHCS
jgi:hypothetical protein